VHLPIATGSLFLRLGAFFWSSDVHRDVVSVDTDGANFVFGFGGELRVRSIGVRLEWESLDIEGDDSLGMLTGSVILAFGKI